jgi:hypothetical protein
LSGSGQIFIPSPWIPSGQSTFANYYYSPSPNSFFAQARICTMPTPDGRKTLIDNLLKVRGERGR